MNQELPKPPGFWKTVGLLLGAARKRSAGRRARQQELLQSRSGGSASNWGGFGFLMIALFFAAINVGAAWVVDLAVEWGQGQELEQSGKIVVSTYFLNAARIVENSDISTDEYLNPFFPAEAERIAEKRAGSESDIERKLRSVAREQRLGGFTSASASGKQPGDEENGKTVVSDEMYRALQTAEVNKHTYNEHYLDIQCGDEAERMVRRRGESAKEVRKRLKEEVQRNGSRNLITSAEVEKGLKSLPSSGRIPAMLGSLVLLWWAVMITFQGEEMEPDLQRRKHPMWEWLFTHPVPPGAVFLSETISPIAANPIYWSGPLFSGFLYGFVYGAQVGLFATFLVGIPVTVAAACLGKALEIGVMLRFSPRTRGAIIGIMGWLGYASFMMLFVGFAVLPKIAAAISRYLHYFAWMPWPWLRLFLGGRQDGSYSFAGGVLTCWLAAGLTITAAVWFSVWGAKQGLAGNFGSAEVGPSRMKERATVFGKDPLYRKEFLWFIRDKSAVVQTILIPLTIASFQLFNLRGIVSHAEDSWNYLSGAAILLGTYFLWVLGPKSLASEGPALWIALTWPRGMESLLKAKAWLWAMVSTGIVLVVLCFAAYMFPGNLWQIGLVGVGWFFFGRSMSEKTVTLVTVTSQSGEPEKIPAGRRWAAQLGMLTFAIGIITQQWHLAVVGIVYSYLTAAAMWQNFRARLPFLYDPWSEKVPEPPTLMHAMISISILIECAAVLMGIASAFTGQEGLAAAQAVGYATSAIAVSIGVSRFLDGRGVAGQEVWNWPKAGETATAMAKWWEGEQLRKLIPWLVVGATGGVALGLFAHGNEAVLLHIPKTAEIIHKSQEEMAKIPGLRVSIAVMAIGFAPFAEEYLFRGLLYRALDREWGGWRAVLGAAAFFAIYHPTLSWLPVGLLAATNSILFKKSGRLAPAVLLHMVYNAVVLLF